MTKTFFKNLHQSKRGAASFFTTMFTILLITIIVLGFTRLILSEATQTSNNDLSQSAYDSALAGIEDAKTTLLKYHECLDKGYNKSSSGSTEAQICSRIIRAMHDGGCNTVASALNKKPSEDGSVVIQETKNSTDKGNSASMLQAYTCVVINEELNDYRATLKPDTSLKVIPLRAKDLNNVKSVKLSWFSEKDKKSLKKDELNIEDGDTLPRAKTNLAPPIISAQLIQSEPKINLSHLSASQNDNSTNIGTVYIKPRSHGSNLIPASALSRSASKSAQHKLQRVKCDPDKTANGFYCHAVIQLPNTFNGGTERNPGASFLIVGLPYKTPSTQIAVQMFANNTGSGTAVPFLGVQARVDSTGRANDLYRRVEARVELTDPLFPFPQNTIELSGKKESLKKAFHVTNNCIKVEKGKKQTCDNYVEFAG